MKNLVIVFDRGLLLTASHQVAIYQAVEQQEDEGGLTLEVQTVIDNMYDAYKTAGLISEDDIVAMAHARPKKPTELKPSEFIGDIIAFGDIEDGEDLDFVFAIQKRIKLQKQDQKAGRPCTAIKREEVDALKAIWLRVCKPEAEDMLTECKRLFDDLLKVQADELSDHEREFLARIAKAPAFNTSVLIELRSMHTTLVKTSA